MVTPRERAENLTLHPYKCYMCEGLIGMCTPFHLYVGAAVFDLTTTFTCGYCKRRTRWKPQEIDAKISPKNNAHNK